MQTNFEAHRTQAAWRDFAIGLVLFLAALRVQSMSPFALRVFQSMPDLAWIALVANQALLVAVIVFAHAALYRLGRFAEVTGTVLSFGRISSSRLSVVGAAALILMFSVWRIVEGPLPWGSEIIGIPVSNFLAISFYWVVTAPVIEEVCFRGWMQRGLGHRFHPAIAIITPAVLFAALHAAVYSRDAYLLIPLALGLTLGLVAERSRALWPSVMLHSLWNIAMLVIAARTAANPLSLAPLRALELIALLAAIGLSSMVVLRVLPRVDERAKRAGPKPVLDPREAAPTVG